MALKPGRVATGTFAEPPPTIFIKSLFTNRLKFQAINRNPKINESMAQNHGVDSGF
jgi:hypothetical protein